MDIFIAVQSVKEWRELFGYIGFIETTGKLKEDRAMV